ncbi:MAG: hypothetical protein AAGJ93_04275, partial [Bacteroidota bacterium]
MRYYSFAYCYLPLLILFFFSACSGTDDRLATSTSPKRAVFYDFFNDVRLEVAALEEAGEERLADFTTETKKFLENREAQEKYKLAGFYFEKGLNRQKGAYDYADRFFPNGCVIHLIIYPPEQEAIWTSLQGYNKGKGKQVGQNYVFYQVFTANPTDEALEN